MIPLTLLLQSKFCSVVMFDKRELKHDVIWQNYGKCELGLHFVTFLPKISK